MQLCFFSDDFSDHFLPLTLTRPVRDLRIGILTIEEKWELALNQKKSASLDEDYFEDIFGSNKLSTESACIWVNERYFPTTGLISEIQSLNTSECIVDGDTLVAAKVDAKQSLDWIENGRISLSSLVPNETSSELSSITFLWDLLSANTHQIEEDIQRLDLLSTTSSQFEKLLSYSNSSQIYISDSAKIEPGCIILADDGPVFIGDGVTLEAGSIIKGPVAVCDNATVKMQARIYGGTTIGPICKIAGEVHNSIFHSYSNKAHNGYVGNSIFGQWCNLGADTNTSNLKNNYSKVSISNWRTKQLYDDGVQFLGTIMGDHSKTAINTQLNTGTVIGVCSNIFHSGFPPKYIPSFSWSGKDEFQVYQFEKALEAMSAMMKRRGIDLTSEYQEMMLKVFNEREL
ncbi:MAG: glucose-1-phosphate thymidylyltransferase [Balneola sp.]|nr:MAG: glucose-1-phosphate thymidylyltransferase [Balneola sp.]